MDSPDNYSFSLPSKKIRDDNDEEELTFQQKRHRKRRAMKITDEEAQWNVVKDYEEDDLMEIDYNKLPENENNARDSFPTQQGYQRRLLKERKKRTEQLETLKALKIASEKALKQSHGYLNTLCVPITENYIRPPQLEELSASYEDELSASYEDELSDSKECEISYSKNAPCSDLEADQYDEVEEDTIKLQDVTAIFNNTKFADEPEPETEFYFGSEKKEKFCGVKDSETKPKPSAQSVTKYTEPETELYFMSDRKQKLSVPKGSESKNKITPSINSNTKFSAPKAERSFGGNQYEELSFSKESKVERENRPVPSVPPKRPVTAFFMFKNEKIEEFKRKFPDAKASEITAKLSETWKNLESYQREEYESRYAELMAAYRLDLRDYEAVYGKAPKKTRNTQDENKKEKNKKAFTAKVILPPSDASDDEEGFKSDGKISGKKSMTSIYLSSPLKERN